MAGASQAVLDILREQLARRLEVLEAYLFGSQARGDAAAHSDIDVAVYVDRERLPPAPYGYAADLTTDLMSALRTNEIDVVVLNDAPPLLYHRVLRDGIRLLSRDLAATTTREARAVSRWCDYQIHLRKVDQALARRLADGSFGQMSPGRLDAAGVRRHLLALGEVVEVLRSHQGRTMQELLSDPEELWIVEHGLQLCAQNALDAATHVATSAGHDVADYAAASDRLADMGVLPRDFAARFRGVAGFRNILIHGYLDVDVALLHRLLNEELDDFPEFARRLGEYLAPPDASP